MIGERMKSLREQHGLSQAALANAIGIAQSSIGNYERGSRIPDSETIIALAKFFDVTSDYLLGLSNDPQKHPTATDQLGLSSEAVDRLISWNTRYPDGKDALYALSKLIVYSRFFDVVKYLSLLLDITNSSFNQFPECSKDDMESLSEKASELGLCLVSKSRMTLYLRSYISKTFEDVIIAIDNITATRAARKHLSQTRNVEPVSAKEWFMRFAEEVDIPLNNLSDEQSSSE